MMWDLPRTVNINGNGYKINTDFRDVLAIIYHLEQSQNSFTELYIAVALFYDDYENISDEEFNIAVEEMMSFINCGEEDDGNPIPKRIDWEQDRKLIISDINKIAHTEIRELPYCHWWTFISWFNAIGEGQLSTVVSIREKLRCGKKLDDWESVYYKEHKRSVDFTAKYTSEEQEEIERLNNILNGGD